MISHKVKVFPSKINLPKKTLNKYHIIAGAFRLESNAENLIKTLTKKGYNPSKLPLNDKGLTPVSFDNFSRTSNFIIFFKL